MGQDTYCVLGVGMPLAFTYANWPTYQKLLFDSGFDEQELYILLVTDFLPGEYDGCHDLAYHMGDAFRDFTDSAPTPQEFQMCTDRLTQQLRDRKWLPADQSIIGLNLQILADINCCHVRGLTRRDNPHIFNQEHSWSPIGLATRIQQVVSELVKCGLPESQIVINSYMWDSQ